LVQSELSGTTLGLSVALFEVDFTHLMCGGIIRFAFIPTDDEELMLG
jgi:hypothetical protein